MTKSRARREDHRQLCAAIRQLAGQRFAVLIVALVITGAMVAGVVVLNVVSTTTFAISILLLGLLSLLAFVSHCLCCAIRQRACYLRLVHNSPWQRHRLRFRQRFGARVLTVPHTAVFLVLGAMGGLWPFLMPLDHPSERLSVLRMLLVLATVAYCGLVIGLAWYYRADVTGRIEQQWREIMQDHR